MRKRARERALAVLVGVLAVLGLVEVGLRVLGGLWLVRQDAAATGGSTIVAISESIGAMGPKPYPDQLASMLGQDLGRRITVANWGRPGADSSILLDLLPEHVERHQPRLVVAMMGANDAFAEYGGGTVPWRGIGASQPIARSLRLFQLVRLATRDRPVDPQVLPPQPSRWYAPATCDRDAPPLVCGEVARAWSLARTGHLGEAEEVLRDAAADDVTGTAWVELGVLLANLRRDQQAGEAFVQATEVAPGSVAAWIERGGLEYRQAIMHLAEQSFERALALAPSEPEALIGRAMTMPEPCSRRPLLLRARELGPDRYLPSFLLAECALEEGDEPAALALLAEAEARYDGDRRWDPNLNRFTDTWEGKGFVGAVDAAFRSYLAGRPDDVVLRSRHASFLRRQGRETEAAAQEREVERLRSSRASPMSRRSWSRLVALSRERGFRVVAAQYPRRDLDQLRRLIDDPEGVVFVDNQPAFEAALAQRPFSDLFTDDCYGDFGHLTEEGARLVARAIADAILREGLLDEPEVAGRPGGAR